MVGKPERGISINVEDQEIARVIMYVWSPVEERFVYGGFCGLCFEAVKIFGEGDFWIIFQVWNKHTEEPISKVQIRTLLTDVMIPKFARVREDDSDYPIQDLGCTEDGLQKYGLGIPVFIPPSSFKSIYLSFEEGDRKPSSPMPFQMCKSTLLLTYQSYAHVAELNEVTFEHDI